MVQRLRIPHFLLFFVCVHWLMQAAGVYGLMFDEAQYWFWGKHPDWGYFSKPPMIAWLMGASTTVFGDGNWGVKMLSPVLLALTALTLYATARRLSYSLDSARWVATTYLTLPLVTGNAMFFSTDVPLQFFWAIAMYGVVSALSNGARRWWLLVGLAAGLGLLSKYTMVAFAVSTLLALLWVPKAASHLRSPYLWLGVLMALVLFAPNLMWNAEHHFVTFAHTNDNVFTKTLELYPSDMLVFVLAQWGLLGPVICTVLFVIARQGITDPHQRLLHSYVWPLAVAGVVVSLIAGAQAHWIAPAYLAAILIVVPWLANHAARWLTRSLILHLGVLVLFYALPGVLAYSKPVHDPLARVFVWNALAHEVRPLVARHPNAVLLTDERKIAAALTYQLRDLRGVQTPVYKLRFGDRIGDHFELLTAQADLKGKPALLILRNPQSASRAGQRGRPLATIELQGYRFTVVQVPSLRVSAP